MPKDSSTKMKTVVYYSAHKSQMIRYESILYQIHVVTKNPLSNALVTLMQEKLTSLS